MRKMLAFLIAAAMLFTSCGSSGSVDTETIADEAEDSLESLTEPEASDETADEPANDAASADTDQNDTDEDDDDSTTTVSRIDDIPEVCRDLMAEFLRDIEPIVSPIDWDTATLTEFETISTEFEARADQFDADSDATGECDDIDLDDDEGFDVLVEFAEQEAPGTAGFLTFIGEFAAAAVDATTGTGDAAFTTCDGAIAFIDGIMSEYDSMEDVPVSEITALAGIATVIFTCTPEQVEYFDSPEVSAFFEGFGE